MAEKSSDTDLLAHDIEDAGPLKRRYSNLACCCCGVWSTIGVVLLVLGILAAVGYFTAWPVGYEFIDLAVGFAAKEMCSAVFVSKRDPITLWNGEYKVAGPTIELGIKVEIINDPPSVRYRGHSLGLVCRQGSSGLPFKGSVLVGCFPIDE